MKYFNELFTFEGVAELSKSYDAVIYLALTLVLFWIGKKVYDFLTPFKVDIELTTNDNKALAVSFAGYMTALGIIIWGVLSSPDTSKTFFPNLSEDTGNLLTNIILVLIWSIAGIILLNIARVINDKILLSKFDNIKEIIKDRNIGTGAVEFGAYVGTAFIIKSVISGEGSGDYVEEILGTIIFFIIGQIAFVLFSKIYQAATKYDLFTELEENDNSAAGVAFGLSLVAIGILLSNPIQKSDSLVYFGIWFVIGAILIILCRIVVDKLIFPDHKIDNEISKDKNWGVGLIEGAISIVIVLLLNASF